MIDVCLQRLLAYNCIFSTAFNSFESWCSYVFRLLVPNIKLILPNFDAVVVAAMSVQCDGGGGDHFTMYLF